jgi:hypothetical protein
MLGVSVSGIFSTIVHFFVKELNMLKKAGVSPPALGLEIFRRLKTTNRPPSAFFEISSLAAEPLLNFGFHLFERAKFYLADSLARHTKFLC